MNIFHKDAVEKWLKSEGKHQTCFTDATRVYLPVDPKTCPPCLSAAEKVVAEVRQLWGGATVYETTGHYTMDSGAKVEEKTWVVEAAHHCSTAPERERLSASLADFGARTNQESVLVRGRNRFVFLRTGQKP